MAGELKALQVIKNLNDRHPMDIVATFMGAHLVPAEYKANRAGPHLGDDAVLHQDPGVLEDLDFPLLRALSGAGTTGGGQHADVGDNGFHVVLLSVIGYKRDAEPLPFWRHHLRSQERLRPGH